MKADDERDIGKFLLPQDDKGTHELSRHGPFDRLSLSNYGEDVVENRSNLREQLKAP
jgi:hypothetical protein